MRGNVAKSEKILILCTALFLLLIGVDCFRETSTGSSDGGWKVETAVELDMSAWIPPEVRRINLNTDPVELLTELPGIGDALAQRIVEYRETNGPFRSAEEIMKVKGIGEKVYHAIADLITVEDTKT